MVPPKLKQALELFKSLPKELRSQVLLEYAAKVPPPPPGVELERVHECQTPFFLATRIDDDGSVHMFFDAPQEAPTVRGFAGIMLAGLDGENAATILAVPDDFFYGMGLEEVVSPLRLRGMGAILARIKAQVRAGLAGGASADT